MAVPSIGSYGRYKLTPPAVDMSIFDDMLTCKAVRQLSEYTAAREDVLTTVYIPLGIPVLDAMVLLEEDTKLNINIVSLQSDKGGWVYVPEYLIIKMPEQEGEPTAVRRLSFNLPITPVYQDLQYLVDSCVDLVLKTKGLKATGRVTTISKEFMYAPSKYQAVSTARAPVITSRGTFYSNAVEALAGLKSTVNKISILEEYLLHNQGESKIPIVTFINTPTIDTSVIDSTDTYVTVTTSPYHANSRSDRHFASNIVVRDTKTQDIVYQSGDVKTLEKFQVPLSELMPGETYDARVSYIANSSASNSSKWTNILNPPATVDTPIVTAVLARVGSLAVMNISSSTFVGHACKLDRYEYTISSPDTTKVYTVTKDTPDVFTWTLTPYALQKQGTWSVTVKHIANRGVSATSPVVTADFNVTLKTPVLTLKADTTKFNRIPVISVSPSNIDSSGGLVIAYMYTVTDPNGKKYTYTKSDASDFTWSPSNRSRAVTGDWKVEMSYRNVKGQVSLVGQNTCVITTPTIDKPIVNAWTTSKKVEIAFVLLTDPDGDGDWGQDDDDIDTVAYKTYYISNPVKWTRIEDLGFPSTKVSHMVPFINTLILSNGGSSTVSIVPLSVKDKTNSVGSIVYNKSDYSKGFIKGNTRYTDGSEVSIAADELFSKVMGTSSNGDTTINALTSLYANISTEDYSSKFTIGLNSDPPSGMIEGDAIDKVIWYGTDLSTGAKIVIDNSVPGFRRDLENIPKSIKGWSFQVEYITKFGATSMSDVITLNPLAAPWVEFSDALPTPFVGGVPVESADTIDLNDGHSKVFRITANNPIQTATSIGALCPNTTMGTGKSGTLDSIYVRDGVEVEITNGSFTYVIPEKSYVISEAAEELLPTVLSYFTDHGMTRVTYQAILDSLHLGTASSHMSDIHGCTFTIRAKTQR